MEPKTVFIKKEKEQTFNDGVSSCINLTDEVIKLYLRGYFDESESVEDILENLIRKMKELR